MTDTVRDKIIALVSEKTGKTLQFWGWVRSEGHGDMKVSDEKGRLYVIVSYDWSHKHIIRSLLTYKRKGSRWSWLCNGQAGTNCKEVAFWPEGGLVYIETREEWEEWVRETFLPDTWDSIFRGECSFCRLPEHLKVAA